MVPLAPGELRSFRTAWYKTVDGPETPARTPLSARGTRGGVRPGALSRPVPPARPSRRRRDGQREVGDLRGARRRGALEPFPVPEPRGGVPDRHPGRGRRRDLLGDIPEEAID